MHTRVESCALCLVWDILCYLHIIQFVNIGDADDGPGLAMSGSWENVTTFADCFNIIIIIIIFIGIHAIYRCVLKQTRSLVEENVIHAGHWSSSYVFL